MSNPQNPQTSNLQADNSVELSNSVDSNIANADTNSVEISPSSVSESPVSAQNSSKNNKTPLVIAGVIGGLVLVTVIAGIGLSSSPKESKSAQNSMSKSVKNEEKSKENKLIEKSMQNSENKSETSQKLESEKFGENKNSQSNQSNGNLTGGSTNSTSANSTLSTNSQNPTTNTNNSQNTNTTQTTNSENKVENKNDSNQSVPTTNSKRAEPELKINEESKAVDRFFEVKATNEKLNLDPKTMTKEDAKILKGDESKFTIPAAPGKKFRVTLKYSNEGDKDFEQATLTVNVDKALKILPGTVKDTFEGKSVTVADGLFKENQIKYGPGTTDKDMAGVKVGQKGEMTIDVEVRLGTAPGDYRIGTTLENPNGGKVGGSNPGIYFLSVT